MTYIYLLPRMFDFRFKELTYKVIAFLILFLIIFFSTAQVSFHPLYLTFFISIPAAFLLRMAYIKQKKVVEDERTILIRNRSQSITFQIFIFGSWVLSLVFAAYAYYESEFVVTLLDHSIPGSTFAEFLIGVVFAGTIFLILFSSILERFLSGSKHEK